MPCPYSVLSLGGGGMPGGTTQPIRDETVDTGLALATEFCELGDLKT